MNLKQQLRQHKISQQTLVNKIKELDANIHISQSSLSEMIAGIKPILPHQEFLIKEAIRELTK